MFEKFQMKNWINEKNFNLLFNCLDDNYQLCQQMAFNVLTLENLPKYVCFLLNVLFVLKIYIF